MNDTAAAQQVQAKPRQPVASFQRQADKLVEEAKLKEAEVLLTEGLKAYPKDTSLEWRLADVEFRLGRHDTAKDRLIRAGRANTAGCDGAFFNAGARLGRATGDKKYAEGMLRAGLDRFPLNSELRQHAGIILADAGQHDRAIEQLEAAVNMDSQNTAAMNALGYSLEQVGALERAERVLRNALARVKGDDSFNILLNLGNVAQKQEKFEEGRGFYERALKFRQPGYLYSNLGALLRKAYDFDAATKIYQKALVIDPANVGSYYNLGNLHKEVGALDAAVRAYDQSVKIDPERASTHWNLSLTLLGAGRLQEGFKEYEWRWRHDGFPSRRRNFPQPQWEGGPLGGRTLLVHAEQGIGDHLQFARFIPALAKLDGRVIVECHEPLMRLFQHYAGAVEVVERLKQPNDFDVHLPLLSAPLVLGIKTFDDFSATPYLAPPADWRFDIPEIRPEAFKIGIIWGGNPNFPGDRERSTNLDYFLRLLKHKRAQLFSLQKGEREPELQEAPKEIVRLSDRIEDFCDTASIMTQMDLVITTCTSTAHLAGALGVPFWALLHHNPDWRWLRHREDSPWYPTARLFQQNRPGDWEGVFEAVERALKALISKH
ncbi:MAG: tetratricopeptide repeat protein [Proteobacteria bacterium]|nr:tetratricopeptide repeat protein [Pseudomonadota bacterium]